MPAAQYVRGAATPWAPCRKCWPGLWSLPLAALQVRDLRLTESFLTSKGLSGESNLDLNIPCPCSSHHGVETPRGKGWSRRGSEPTEGCRRATGTPPAGLSLEQR